MDFKGITWAGNMYQKFEAMCLEVEEVMYQDTVKYVENQVQKVSVSVKKFYSEVMEDLLLPSCVDPMKVPSADSFFDPYAHTDINKKQMPSLLDNPRDLKKKENEDEVISHMTAEKGSPLNGHYDVNSFSPRSPGVLVQDKCYEVSSGKTKKIGVYRRPVGIKRIPQNNHPSKGSYQATPLSGARSRKLASCDLRSSSLEASGDRNVLSSSDLDVRHDTGEAVKGNALISDKTPSHQILSAESERQKSETSKGISSVSDNIASAESARLKKGDSECTSSCRGSRTESICTSMNENSFSNTGSGIAKAENKEVMTFNEGISINDGSSDVSRNICHDEASDKEVLVSNEDNFDMEVIKNEEFAQLRLEISEPVQRPNLEDSCVLVEGYVPQGTGRNSYKKKIRQALLSKLRSTRQHNECAPQHKDLHGNDNVVAAVPVLTIDSEKREFPANHSLESDWELL
ncbi:uncharacterized protein LOC105176815 isoform X1 [Sesamum indicum]|uniref:Uncharacterized protein LOC105176815 isoform X1 n=1 Tax=Sesamum indicum TaxID=4182 RepID=A0A6I9UJ15_SESIN|nr:uncharacterized protein LOC105176815 isoform X1 [Sesamum indicum]XP_011098033.1 uncharacterized protein LOC105176815 isoform X1 [Sesamum indicum]